MRPTRTQRHQRQARTLRVLSACLLAFAVMAACMGMLTQEARSGAGVAFGDTGAGKDLVIGEPILPTAVQIAYRDPASGSYVPCDFGTAAGKDAKVIVARYSLDFDVLVSYSDGTVKTAEDAGLAVRWDVDNTVQAGVACVDVNRQGTVALSGSSSKLVRLSAQVEGAEVDTGAVFVNLVGDVAAPASGRAVESIAVTGGGAGTYAPAGVGADEVLLADVASISSAGGSASFSAELTFVNSYGMHPVLSPEETDADMAWQVESFFDENGARTDVALADASTSGQAGTVSGSYAGGGWTVVRCASSANTGFWGQEFLVHVKPGAAGSAEARRVVSGQLVYFDDDVAQWRPYEGYSLANSPTVIDRPRGTVPFDVRLGFADGSSVLAADSGFAVDYRLAGNIVRGRAIAQIGADGVLHALRVRNGTVRIAAASFNGFGVAGTPAYIRLLNNDQTVRPTTDSVSVSALSQYWIAEGQKPDDAEDDWYWKAVPTAGTARYTVPLVVSTATTSSECTLTAAIAWTDSSTTTTPDEDGAYRAWSLESCLDSDGGVCPPLVTVSEGGVVKPTGAGSGFATIRCVAVVPLYDDAGNSTYTTLEGTVRVAVYSSNSYVKSIVMLDDAGEGRRSPIDTTSIVLPRGKNSYQFAVRITEVGYDPDTHEPRERVYEVPSSEVPRLDKLEWSTYRTEERAEEEHYSEITQTGNFHALNGFARAYVYANLKRSSFTGRDLGCGVMVMAEDSMEYLGRTESLDVTIYHYSDYTNHGADAPVAKQLTLSRAQLAGMADYTTWYTFQRREEAFSTAYAHGLTMRNLLALCGVDPERLVSMAFVGADGYYAERHSASFILGSQYRYTNYYFHKDLPGLMKQQAVSPMLALEYYMKNNAGYEDATDKDNARDGGYDYMTSDSTFRIIFGMTGPNIRNANQSVSKVGSISIVVEDNTFPPDPEQAEPDPVDKPDPKEEERKDPEDDPAEKKDADRDEETQGEKQNEDDENVKDPEPEEPEEKDDEPKKKDDDKPKKHDGAGKKGDENNNSKKAANPFDGPNKDGVGTDKRHGGTVAVTESGSDLKAPGEEDATNDKDDDPGGEHGLAASDTENEGEADDAAEDEETSDEDVLTPEERKGNPSVRELKENLKAVVPPAEIDPVWWFIVGAGSTAALVTGGALSGQRFVRNREDGEEIHS